MRQIAYVPITWKDGRRLQFGNLLTLPLADGVVDMHRFQDEQTGVKCTDQLVAVGMETARVHSINGSRWTVAFDSGRKRFGQQNCNCLLN